MPRFLAATALAAGAAPYTVPALAHGFADQHMFISTRIGPRRGAGTGRLRQPGEGGQAGPVGDIRVVDEQAHVGLMAQFHLYFDDLLPHSLGKPIVQWLE